MRQLDGITLGGLTKTMVSYDGFSKMYTHFLFPYVMVFYKRLAATCGWLSLLLLGRLSRWLLAFLRIHLCTTPVLSLGKKPKGVGGGGGGGGGGGQIHEQDECAQFWF